MTTIAFDVYGTLIDTSGVLDALGNLVGEKASAFSDIWRNKQLEYSFRRGLMQNYQPFSVCTHQALNYTCALLGINLGLAQKKELMDLYRVLPAFPDVPKGLAQLQHDGFRLFAFSNGEPEALEALLTHAGIRDLFQGVISVDPIRSFKPNPAVYNYFLRQIDSSENAVWLVSSNPFDVIGAIAAGINAAWIRRSQSAVFDPWGIEPTLTVSDLNQLSQKKLQEVELLKGRDDPDPACQ
ncbi:MAG: haloacid dehalogenase type II [Desulfuromonas sp.]|nr:MAG: haloacid dehalogenase type II [Desulfuromonas sp.]